MSILECIVVWVLSLVISCPPIRVSGDGPLTQQGRFTVDPNKNKTCPLSEVFDQKNVTCKHTWTLRDRTGQRVGEGSKCWYRAELKTHWIKCMDGIWKHINEYSQKHKRDAWFDHFDHCPEYIHANAPPGQLCAVVTWDAPEGESDSHTGGNPGDCFPEGSSKITYRYDGWLGADWISGDSCTFNVIVKVFRCPSLSQFRNGVRSCSGPRENLNGARCTHTGNNGYMVQGSSSITCQQEHWSAPLPQFIVTLEESQHCHLCSYWLRLGRLLSSQGDVVQHSYKSAMDALKQYEAAKQNDKI